MQVFTEAKAEYVYLYSVTFIGSNPELSHGQTAKNKVLHTHLSFCTNDVTGGAAEVKGGRSLRNDKKHEKSKRKQKYFS